MSTPSLRHALRDKYPLYADLICDRFQEANGVRLDWAHLTKAHLSAFVDLLQSKVARSTARTHCAMLKAVIALYDDQVSLAPGWRQALSVKADISEQVYLTDAEIHTLIDYRPVGPLERAVRNRFLLGCLTGARHSDFALFTPDNIRDGYLNYVSVKTHTKATIPVAPLVEKLIRDYQPTHMADATFNKLIRIICRECGVQERLTIYRRGGYTTGEKYLYVSSHTARRSFATNLYLRGADLYSISKMMGHSSVDMTSGYICCGLRHLPDNVMDYFRQFGAPNPPANLTA